MTLILTVRMGQGQMLICHSKGYMRLYVLAIVLFVLSVTVCKIITYKLPNVNDSNLETLKTTLTISIKISWQT